MIRTEKAKVSCNDCGFEWFGATSAHALRLLGSCTRCHGELSFADEVSGSAPSDQALAANTPAHLVLGNPRL